MYRGVYETSWGGTFFVSIKKGGKRYYLGTYRDAESAARVYDEAALRLHGESARLNFSPLVGRGEDGQVDHGEGDPRRHEEDVDDAESAGR